jgi:hypothetical protein
LFGSQQGWRYGDLRYIQMHLLPALTLAILKRGPLFNDLHDIMLDFIIHGAILAALRHHLILPEIIDGTYHVELVALEGPEG